MWRADLIPAGDNNREPARPLALARVLVGLAALLQLPRASSRLTAVLAPGAFHAPYPLSPSISAASGPLLIWLMAFLAVAAILGWRTRLALAALAVSLAFMFALDQQLYTNDMWLLLLECFLLSLSDSGAAISLDARRLGSKDFVERWPVLLMKIQLTIVYASTALSKINPSFLRGDILASALRFDLPPRIVIAMSLATIALELFLAVALWFRLTLRPAMLLGFLLHTTFIVVLASGSILPAFGLEMLALYLLFPAIRPREFLVICETRSRFLLTCITWCRRLDWLQACKFEVRQAPSPAMPLLLIHASKRFSRFEAFREIALVLPATLFLAPILDFPGVRILGERFCRRFSA